MEAASASLRVPATLRSTEDIANIHAAIVESEFLQRYSYTQLASLCRACELREIKPGETLFGEGDVGDHFFVLIKGAVDVYKEFLGQGRKCVATLHDSGSFGELALLRVTSEQTNKQTNGLVRRAGLGARGLPHRQARLQCTLAVPIARTQRNCRRVFRDGVGSSAHCSKGTDIRSKGTDNRSKGME